MIYKPTDLSPSAQTFDVKDVPVFFECKVDTSNVQAQGFTIEIYDSENNIVFSSIPRKENGDEEELDIKYITLISELKEYVEKEYPVYVEGYSLVNTGYNGTYLKVPVFVPYEDRAENTVGRSQMYYSEEGLLPGSVVYSSNIYMYTRDALDQGTYNEYKGVDVYNGHEYKWSITLYQLEDIGDARTPIWVLPRNPLYYDMPLTVGTVLGSNNIRIQSVCSDEIYQDYFVQPVKIEGLAYNPDNPKIWRYDQTASNPISQNKSNRVMIKAYDYSYGYIYPQTGENGFAAETITPEVSNGFRVYKRGNNRDNLTATQQVSYVIDEPLDGTVAVKWENNRAYSEGSIVSYNSFYFQANQAVSAGETNPMDNAKWGRYFGNTWEWVESEVNPGESYGIYTCSKTASDRDNVYNIAGCSFVGNERTILNHQSTNAAVNSNGNYLGSPYNGIYYPKFLENIVSNFNSSIVYHAGDVVTYEQNTYECKGVVKGKDPKTAPLYWTHLDQSVITSSYDNTKPYYKGDYVKIQKENNSSSYDYYKCTGAVRGETPTSTDYWESFSTSYVTVNWFRTPDADSWGELANKIVLVTDSNNSNYYGKNLQIKDINDNADVYGTINQTQFIFVEEKPVEIYKNSYSLYDSTKEYKAESIVKYLKSGTYSSYDSTISYNPGTVVYKTDSQNIIKHYICIKTALNKDPVTNEDYWSEYKAESYYIATANNPSNAPVNDSGTVQSGWVDNPYLGSVGVIFYNNSLGEPDPISDPLNPSTNGRLYIRKFEGVQSGMMLMKNSLTNTQEYIKIKEYNKEYNFVTYDKVYTYNTYVGYNNDNPEIYYEEQSEWVPADQVGVGTKYQIKTFFRESDENAFWFYAAPNVVLHYKDVNGSDFVEDRKLTVKYYEDYAQNVPLYDNNARYAKGDVVVYNDGYYEAKKDLPVSIPSNNSSWDDVTGIWEEPDSWHLGSRYEVGDYVIYKKIIYRCKSTIIAAVMPPENNSNWDIVTVTTTTYNKYFSYKKGEIVEYDNKNDFLLYDSSNTYSYYDKVRNGNNYYISKKNGNQASLTDTNSWENVNLSNYNDTVYYVAMTDISKGTAPSYINIGKYWQQYVGELTEDNGFVNAVLYYNNYDYDIGTKILYDGLYFVINKKNESYGTFLNYRNEHGDKIWELAQTYDSNVTYTGAGFFEWGAPVAGEATEGRLCYSDDGITWTLFGSVTGDDRYEGIRYAIGLADEQTIPPSKLFNKNSIYPRTTNVFSGEQWCYLYTVVAETSGHLPKYNVSSSTNEYFIREAGGNPLDYPRSKDGKAWDETRLKYKYVMGDVVLSKGLENNSVPDVYRVKVENTFNNPDSSTFIPESSHWDTYAGPIYIESDSSEAADYNNVILNTSDNLYYIKKNINDDLSSFEPVAIKSIEDWDANDVYEKNDIVLYNDYIYIYVNDTSTSEHKPEIESEYWELYPWQLYTPEITERTLCVSADYQQQQYIQWKSAQWFLIDANGKVVDKSDVFYDGELSYTFHGLDGRDEDTGRNKVFVVRLILETYTGQKETVDRIIETTFVITEIENNDIIDVSFDCDTTSIIAVVTKESGFIIPSNTEQVIYTNDNDGTMELQGEIKYDKISNSINNNTDYSDASDIISTANRFVQQGSISIQSDKFFGNLLALQSLDEQDNIVGETSVYIPNPLKEVNGWELYPNDSILSKETFAKINENRYNLKWASKQNGTSYSGNLEIRDIAAPHNYVVEGNYSGEDGDLRCLGEYVQYYTIPVWQKPGFFASFANYLPVSYEYTKETVGANLEEKYFNVSLPYNIYTQNGEFSELQDFHHIQQPLVSEDQFSLVDSYARTKAGTRFAVAEFQYETSEGNNAEENSNGTKVLVKALTSTMYSDYVFDVPYATFVGHNNDGDVFTKKNVWTSVSWLWDDDGFWEDADYIDNANNYNSVLGSISINGSVYKDMVYDEDHDIKYSKTVFNPQTELNILFEEQRYLNGKSFVFDLDLSMEENGLIYPTDIEDLDNEQDGNLKMVAYVATGD